jgi:hypothetical protein
MPDVLLSMRIPRIRSAGSDVAGRVGAKDYLIVGAAAATIDGGLRLGVAKPDPCHCGSGSRRYPHYVGESGVGGSEADLEGQRTEGVVTPVQSYPFYRREIPLASTEDHRGAVCIPAAYILHDQGAAQGATGDRQVKCRLANAGWRATRADGDRAYPHGAFEAYELDRDRPESATPKNFSFLLTFKFWRGWQLMVPPSQE